MSSGDTISTNSSETPTEHSASTGTEPSTDAMPPNSPGNDGSPSRKRSASTSEPNGSAKIAKRRASRACVNCRNRKVRCNVVECTPCNNCRWNEVECVVQESRRRKKTLFEQTSSVSHDATTPQPTEAHLKAKGSANPVAIASAAAAPALVRRPSDSDLFQTSPDTFDNDTDEQDQVLVNDYVPRGQTQPEEAVALPTPQQPRQDPTLHGGSVEGHVPHLLYQRPGLGPDPVHLQASNNGSRYPSIYPSPPQRPMPQGSNSNLGAGTNALKTVQLRNSFELPAFIQPMPARNGPGEVRYLQQKGALTLPSLALQNALLRGYVQYVHPYMPLIELHELLSIVNARDGRCGQISLFLYQSVMFAAVAFVELNYLKEAGFTDKKAARKAFFLKARLLYDFDYESDRLTQVQGLLLMTYWYETPTDQKDTWHWMGVAISLAQLIGLHRDPAHKGMPQRKKRLWKRIWWSCFMRDRMIALGMRRPLRIQDEEFDVPMLDESDFEIEPLPDEIKIVGPECPLMRDVGLQRELALLCIAKAKLCICIGHMIKASYSVLSRDKSLPETTTNNTMLFPIKQLDNVESINRCDRELKTWVRSLPACCQHRPLSAHDVEGGRATLAVQRNLLHLVYHSTMSALYRPRFWEMLAQGQDISRVRVYEAAMHITCMVQELSELHLVKRLPTTGVTVLMPAIIIHLLLMKSPVEHMCNAAVKGFGVCIRAMQRLREMYSSADYATKFCLGTLGNVYVSLSQRIDNEDFKSAVFAHFAAIAEVPGRDMTTPPPDNISYPQEVPSFYPNPSPSYNTGDLLVVTDPTTNPAAAVQQFLSPTEHMAKAESEARMGAGLGWGLGHCDSPPNSDGYDMMRLDSASTSSLSDASHDHDHDQLAMDAWQIPVHWDNSIWSQFFYLQACEGVGGGSYDGGAAGPMTMNDGGADAGGMGLGNGLFVRMSEIEGSADFWPGC
ncbi:Uu.00g092620.m01.CDS01 [Anthostomella pinea]|uniref:Uu.00g092620.m01.CDS01 n=1 Tax=Anthostomella pinea TaxID=933095 RepID=A0AAI8VNA2_9PEZI|nr:Uu.00g092620.m01.CDS01 [Anthostomella pinea]